MAKNKLLIVVGESGSGKTKFAKRYAKDHQATYLDFDLLFNYRDTQNGCTKFVNKLTSLIKTSSNTSFVLDGYIFYNMPTAGFSSFHHAPLTIAYLEDKLDAKIKLCLCFAAPHILRRRQLDKARRDPLHQKPKKTEAILQEEVEAKFFGVVVLDDNPILVDTTNDAFPAVNRATFPQRWQELLLLSDLENMNHDQFYQDINLPSGVLRHGYSESTKTWDRLSSMIEFKDKSVLDIGCFHGFFSFKAEEAGAKTVTGIDHSIQPLNVARRIGWLKNAKAVFSKDDLDDLTIEQTYDIVLVLNMLHYSKNIDRALQNVFRAGNLIVFEIPIEQEKIISQHAYKYGFKLNTKADSYRLGRAILIFKNSHSTTALTAAPEQYRFSIPKYRFHRFIQWVKRFPITYPIRYLVRKYRQYRREKA